MIRPEALTRLRLLVGAVRTSLVAGDRELPPLRPGQPIDGRVEQQSRAGYIVSVRGRSYDFKLPDGTRPGDLLRMVYVNDNPRPTFALLGIERANDQAESKLSDAGKLLAMLREFQIEAPDEPAARAAIPVFQSRVPEAPQAATLLREALALSGLFYESHQAQWVLGTRSTAQLQREPQGKLAPMQPAAAAAMMELQAFPVSEEAIRRADAMPTESAHGAEADPPSQTEQVARSPAHPDTFPIIRQQLGALESGHVAWRGQVWPGQFMEWQVGDSASHAEEDREVPRAWRTELKLTLPNIGELLARIELDANGAKLRLIADSEQHARRLREQAPALANRFNTSGIPIHALEVSHGPETT
ncbi:MAG: flagellar hook-length control protein FliK [Betaproteobacteria bacterium]|nr:flagellar hook-length control protein FliK [Betaproteobacteria bacterium]